MDNPEGYRRCLFKTGLRLQFCPYISNCYFGNTGCGAYPVPSDSSLAIYRASKSPENSRVVIQSIRDARLLIPDI
ncbi:MAG: hypothetical protein DYG83_06290 [Candidatus Brocadia sp. AMX2]|nr:MAG: hypothetical protein EDM70_04315 [Candidatus Brocadia sp. AMX2]MBL1169408.1 hypothetical protein [Candidatus Brocadia sp. AMX1]MCE7866428.1 hypothetical protein [Candidatus Brocadia sp. AMX2]MCQ3917184.1 hypothetical protein [Candidatus Brocadia sp.]RIJ91715.1 MAG: hypothetical protein DB853_06990 [Candidatus Brocadia sp.]